MNYPNFREEKLLWKQGFNFVVGLDEAGRGPLAGPVVAVAAMVWQFQISNFKFQINDSKKLNAKKREKTYKDLINHPDITWGIGIVSEKVIDKINILNATKLAMKRAVTNLWQKNRSSGLFDRGYLILDGNFALNNINIPQKSIVKGDEKVFSIAAASIIAKITRDRLMKKMHKKYPQYNFASHKGYGTKLHMKNLKNFGPCKIHRKSFFPVSALVKNEFV